MCLCSFSPPALDLRSVVYPGLFASALTEPSCGATAARDLEVQPICLLSLFRLVCVSEMGICYTDILMVLDSWTK